MSFEIKKAVSPYPPSVAVPLTRGMVSLVSYIDSEKVLKSKWYADKIGGNFYAVRHENGKKIYMHRQLACPDSSDRVVDHIDGNGLNNRRLNLRICTKGENCRNGRKRNGSSQYKGVSFDRSRGKWKAQIKVNYKGVCIGRFDAEQEAANAYDSAAVRYFGQFAKTNFVVGGAQ